MVKVKRFFLLVFLAISTGCLKIPATVTNSTNINLVRPKENAVIIAENENLIFPKGKTKNRLFKINFTRADVNDGKIAEQRDTAPSQKIKSGKMKSRIARLFSKPLTTTTQPNSTQIQQNPTPEILVSTSSTNIAMETKISNIGEIESDSNAPNENKTTSKKTRTPVKLNMKQGLIMNQVLSTYGLTEVNNSLCRNHVNEFKAGLRAFEPWAIKMFDASSKLMSGILGGNLAEFGAYQQCLNIYEETHYGPIKGRHCTLYIHPTDELVKIVLSFKRPISEKHFQNLKDNILEGAKLSWSVCVPDSCTHEDVLRHFNKNIIDVTEGLNLTLSLSQEHCVSIDELPKFTDGDYIYMSCVGLVITAVVISTVMDMLNEDQASGLINSFSLPRNAAILFSTRESKNDISCLHGIRFLTMYLIVYGHRYVHNLATPVVNYMDLVDWLETYFSTTVHGGTTTVDTFFLVASTLLSYTFFNMVAKGMKVNLVLFYLNRHLRLLVPLALAVGTYVTVLKHFGSGPLQHDMTAYYSSTCRYFWWSTMLYIQPFVNARAMCIVQTWFLSVDMFWYYFSPLMLLALARNEITGYLIMFGVYSGCTAANFYIAWIREFNGQMPVAPSLLESDYFAYHYTQPIVRGGPYILGLAFGHTLFKTKDQKVKISLFTKTAGWIVVSLGMPSIVLMTRSFRLEDFEYNRLFASLYLASHRSFWTFGLMWIIWCCENGHAGYINSFLSCTLFRIMGRLCYNVYLFHYIFQAIMQNSKMGPTYFSNFLSIYDSVSDMVLMLLLSVPLTLCFEYPFTRLCGLMFKPKKIESDTTKVKPQNLEKF